MNNSLTYTNQTISAIIPSYRDVSSICDAIGTTASSCDADIARGEVNEACYSAQQSSPESNAVVNEKTKCKMVVDEKNIYVHKYFKGRYIDKRRVMPGIVDVKVYRDSSNCERSVTVKFADDTSERATICDGDAFSYEYGISVCITKKLLSMNGLTMGHSLYNKIMNRAFKVMEDKEKEAELKKAEDERIKKKIAKLALKREKRKQRMRNEEIEIRKEAYVRAMHEMKTLGL